MVPGQMHTRKQPCRITFRSQLSEFATRMAVKHFGIKEGSYSSKTMTFNMQSE